MKNILVMSLGGAPQIATETLWALVADPTVSEERRFQPDEMHVLTTTVGYRNAREALFDPGERIDAFCREFSIPRFPVTVHEVGRGEAFDDLRDLETNFLFADAAIRLIRDFTARDDSRIHVSMAGGRKTMSFFVGVALILFGRPHDRLFHVLVPAFYEGCPDFWWPPTPPAEVEHRFTRERRSTAEATIELVEVPFLRLRAYLPENLARSAQGYRTWVSAIQAAMEEPVGILDDATQTLSVGDHRVCIRQPQQYALYRYLVEAAIERRPGAGPDGVDVESFGWVRPHQEFVEWDSRGFRRYIEIVREMWERRKPGAAAARIENLKASIEASVNVGDRAAHVLTSKQARIRERRPISWLISHWTSRRFLPSVPRSTTTRAHPVREADKVGSSRTRACRQSGRNTIQSRVPIVSRQPTIDRIGMLP